MSPVYSRRLELLRLTTYTVRFRGTHLTRHLPGAAGCYGDIGTRILCTHVLLFVALARCRKEPSLEPCAELTKILTISSARDDCGLWGIVLRGGKALLYPDLAGRSARNDYLSLPRFWCRIILHRYLRSLGDCGRCSKVQSRKFRYRSVRSVTSRCLYCPGSSSGDHLVENGRPRRMPLLAAVRPCVPNPCHRAHAPRATVLDQMVA